MSTPADAPAPVATDDLAELTRKATRLVETGPATGYGSAHDVAAGFLRLAKEHNVLKLKYATAMGLLEAGYHKAPRYDE